jgi:23S rRNA (pseudouridine1915-N3)-methyltransferase
MPIKIITVGRRHDTHIAELIGGYEKRLRSPYLIEWLLIPNSSKKGITAREEESQAIQSRINSDNLTILLDERGKMLDSPALSRLITEPLSHSRTVVFIVGGAYGVSEELRQKSHRVWSLSDLVFPHQLVRLLLAEQLYRAQCIEKNIPYHNV